MRYELTLRYGRTRPTRGRSSGSETLLHIRSLAGYIIVTPESSFQKRQPFAIASGAADMALLMISSSVIFPAGILCGWATANPEPRSTEHPNVSATCRMDHLLNFVNGTIALLHASGACFFD